MQHVSPSSLLIPNSPMTSLWSTVYILYPVVFSVAQKSQAKTLFPQIGNGFVSATVLSIFPYLFSSTLLLYYSFQFSNRYAMRAEAKPFLCTSIRRTLTLDIRSKTAVKFTM